MRGTSVYSLPADIMRLPHNDQSSVSPATSVPIFGLRSRVWSYRGEGNANLVLALPDERVIVRLRKCPEKEGFRDAVLRLWREAEFCRGIMRPLLGDCFVHVPKIVKIPEWELQVLRQTLLPLRPMHRKHKSTVSSVAAVFPDFCLLPQNSNRLSGPTFCVEVKPKQGWIPLPDRRLTKCTFCLNQFLKLQSGSILEKSGYCPLDLFSGDPQRMESAVRRLLKSPQNNLKVFRNGKLAFGEESNSYLPVLIDWFGEGWSEEELLDNFSSIVVKALTAKFGGFVDSAFIDDSSQPQNSTHSERIPQDLIRTASDLLSGETTCFQPSQSLPPGCILNRILRLQQLDEMGSDEAYRLYSSSPHTDFDYVQTLLRDTREIFEPLHSYLLATTAKDCSILIAFQRTESDEPFLEDLTGNRYLFNIGVSDLDPKPMSCIDKHKKRDLEVVRSCIAWFHQPNHC